LSEEEGNNEADVRRHFRRLIFGLMESLNRLRLVMAIKIQLVDVFEGVLLMRVTMQLV